MHLSQKIAVGVMLGVQATLIFPHYIMETIVKANFRNLMKPFGFRN